MVGGEVGVGAGMGGWGVGERVELVLGGELLVLSERFRGRWRLGGCFRRAGRGREGGVEGL